MGKTAMIDLPDGRDLRWDALAPLQPEDTAYYVKCKYLLGLVGVKFCCKKFDGNFFDDR